MRVLYFLKKGVLMRQTVFDYETKAFLSILAISLIGMSIVVSQQPITSQVFYTREMLKPQPTDTFLLKNIDVGDFIGKDITVLTKVHLKSLADGKITTNAGKTDYAQYLVLKKTDSFDGGQVIFGRDESARTGNYLTFVRTAPLFEYVISFTPGLVSRIKNDRLIDLENKYITILGKSFVIVNAQVYEKEKRVKLRLMGSEGIIDFEDKNYADTKYGKGVKVNNKQIDADLRIVGQSIERQATITELRYAPLAATRSGNDVFIAPRQGLRNRLRYPESLLVNSLEVIYGGVSGESAPTMQGVGGGEFALFAPKGRNKYDLTFTNDLGVRYDIPLVTTEGGTFKYGSEKKDLVYVEGSSTTDYNIDRGDYFVVNNKNDINAVTNVFEHNGVNNDAETINFVDIGTGQEKTVSFDEGTRKGELIASGNTYTFYVSSTSPYPVVVDQNADGTIDGGEARIVLRVGGRLDLGSSNSISGSSITVTLTTPKRLFAEPSSDEVVSMTLTRTGNELDISVPDQSAITMYHERSGLDKGMTEFGVFFLRDKRGKTSSQLMIEYPRTGVFSTPAPTVQGQGSVAITLERQKYLRKQE